MHYYQDEHAAEGKIREILSTAGVRGQWMLATYYRFDDIQNIKNVDWHDVYFDIVEATDSDDPSYPYQLGELYVQFAIGQKDINKKREDYETALSFFIDTMNRGGHSAYKKAQETTNVLLQLFDDENKRNKIKEKTDAVIPQHSKILSLLSQKESVLIGHLLSE